MKSPYVQRDHYLDDKELNSKENKMVKDTKEDTDVDKIAEA